MKRWAVGIVVFLLTFTVGVVAAWLLLSEVQPAPPAGVDQELLTVQPEPIQLDEEAVNTEADVEFFSDEKRIGRRGKNKVELKCFERGETRFAAISFYWDQGSKTWELKQSFEFMTDSAPPCMPEVKDFNNDGLGDFTFWSDPSARGANELRRLFVYDKKSDKFVHIKNSNEYSNLEFNRNTNSLTAWHIYGATSTIFLRIEGDILKEFASVHTGDELVAETVSKNGRRRVIYRKKMHQDDIYSRYSTFDPPKP